MSTLANYNISKRAETTLRHRPMTRQQGRASEISMDKEKPRDNPPALQMAASFEELAGLEDSCS